MAAQEHRGSDEDDSELEEEGTSGAADTATVGIAIDPSVPANFLYQRLKNTECDLRLDPHGPIIHAVGMELVDPPTPPNQSVANSKKLLLVELPDFVNQKTQGLGQTKWLSEIRLPSFEVNRLCGITYIDSKNIFIIVIFLLTVAFSVVFSGTIGYSIWLHSRHVLLALLSAIFLSLFETLIYVMAVQRVFDIYYIIWYVLQFLFLMIKFSFLVFLIIGLARDDYGSNSRLNRITTSENVLSIILIIISTIFSFTLLWTAHIMRQFIQIEDQSMRSIACVERAHKVLCEKPLFLWAIGLFHVHKHQ